MLVWYMLSSCVRLCVCVYVCMYVHHCRKDIYKGIDREFVTKSANWATFGSRWLPKIWLWQHASAVYAVVVFMYIYVSIYHTSIVSHDDNKLLGLLLSYK